MNKKRHDKAIAIYKNLKPKDKKLIGELIIYNRDYYKWEYEKLEERVKDSVFKFRLNNYKIRESKKDFI